MASPPPPDPSSAPPTPPPGPYPPLPAPRPAGYGPPGYGPPGYAPPPGQLPPGYVPPGYPPPYPVSRGTNTMAILALVFSLVVAPVGIILGHIARKQIRETGEDGDTLALVGMIIGYVYTGLMVAVCLGYVVFAVAIFGAIGFASV